MMRRKNLERAVVLGLLLSTSVYGSAWAAFWEEEENDVKINYGLGTTVEQSKVDEIVKPGQNLVIETNSVPVWYQGSLTLTNGDLKIDTTSNSGANAIASGWGKDHKLEIFAKDIYIDAGANGIFTTWGEPENLETGSGHIFIGSETKKVDNLFIRAGGQGVDNKKGSVTIYASGEIDITSMKTSGVDPDQAAINNTADNGTVIVNGETIKLTAVGGSGIINDGRIYKKFFGYVYPSDHVNSTTTLDSKNLIIDASAYGIRNNVGTTNINTLESNVIKANIQSVVDKNTGEYIGVFGNNSAIHALDGGTVNLLAGKENLLYGSIYANGNSTTVYSKGIDSAVISNKVYSAAVIENAGDLDGKETNGDVVTGMDVVSALYAEEGAEINLSGVNDIRTYYGDPNDEHTSERVVWAYKGANITLDGTTNISTYKYEVSPENRDIAIAAGTATKLDSSNFTDTALEEVRKNLATVNLNYQAGSSISGDILAAYGGEVNIKDNNITTASVGRNSAATGINITGDLLAGNTGKLTVYLGNGGSLTGRADDYGDASTEHIKYYNPAFSSNIIQGGDVTLNMGDNSHWDVQGQSWITTVNTNGNALIDLTNVSTGYKDKYASHALTIRNLNGDANIKMHLDGTRSQSDMLYIGQGNGEYNIELDELVYVEDMYAKLNEDTNFSGLRFATVGKGSEVKFNVTATDKGFNNVRYTVDTDVYNSEGENGTKHENDAYNGGQDTTWDKPGNDAVDDLLSGNAMTTVDTTAANNIALTANETGTVNENDNKTQHLNYKLVAMESDGPTDAGKTMLNMSRANYSNAIYMDRLNKRLGEARYINDDPEEDEGMWVRIRHDRIGREDAFRSQNTMYELGYDKRQECDNGKRRVGFAVDYMHGDTGYNDIAGKGEIDRYGLWLYDTWTGNKGHYADYVAKWGHLQNDFEVYTMTGGEKVTGDYSNNVFSISAEYGRKKDMGNDWYIEPQAQLQLARVTGADYTTSQGTKVSVDGINSLIGRAGFRLGKDFGEEKQSTVYFKADVLHEFLGDQTIRAMDGTTDGWQTVDYENKGTWYDVGFGFATKMSKNSYAFMDFEKSFGNDNDETYQINVGMQWSF